MLYFIVTFIIKYIGVVVMSYVFDRHTIRNKSEEAFIAFKEALKFKYVCFISNLHYLVVCVIIGA